jgi:hypothetical protein
MAFNVRRYLIRVRGGQQYLPVAARLVWFREEHPDWSIETHPLHLDIEGGCVVFQAVVKDAQGRIIATASKMETRDDFADPPPEAMVCAECGRALRKPQYDLSMAKFHRPLCPTCQRRAQPAAPTTP